MLPWTRSLLLKIPKCVRSIAMHVFCGQGRLPAVAVQCSSGTQSLSRPHAASQPSRQAVQLPSLLQHLAEQPGIGLGEVGKAECGQRPDSLPQPSSQVVTIFRWPAALSPSSVSVVGVRQLVFLSTNLRTLMISSETAQDLH